MTKDLSFQEFLDQYTEVNLSMTYVGTKPVGIYLVNSTDLHFVNCDGCTDFKDSVAKVIDDIVKTVSNDKIYLQVSFYFRNWLDVSKYNKEIIVSHESIESYKFLEDYENKKEDRLSNEEYIKNYFHRFNGQLVDDIGYYINEKEEKLTEAFYEDSELDIIEVKEQIDNFVESVK